MTRICAWCGRFLGTAPPQDDRSTTHGICPECEEYAAAEVDRLHAAEEAAYEDHAPRSARG